MTSQTRHTIIVALTVALGGFLMGFDASVISGVVTFIEPEFQLSKIELGWAVASLTLTATLGMMMSGPLSDRFGRRPVLRAAALVFTVSALGCAVAPNYTVLVMARMLGGFGVGAALILAPLYIAEIAPRRLRGRMVSLNQLNIVVGISAAFFSNYLILRIGQSDLSWAETLRFNEWAWRWMLGIEALPAIIYFFALRAVPESPRWLVMKGREQEALEILESVAGRTPPRDVLAAIHDSIEKETAVKAIPLAELFKPSMRLVLTIGISVAVLQQITGINSVFFYAPMIFEQSGIGTDASFMQAVLVGLVNLLFTLVAISLIDKLGRRPLLGFGLTGIAVCMFLLAWGFGSATYSLTGEAIAALPAELDRAALATLQGVVFGSDVEFRAGMVAALGSDAALLYQSDLLRAAISMNATLILVGILGFVASFAMSLGPVMWVLFSELFPNRVRGLAISFVGLINSAVSFTVQLVFPWELETLGNATTFFIYGVFAVLGFLFVMRLLPETNGRSLEELEATLVGSNKA